MRHTETTPKGINQEKLDQFWDLIEDKYEEYWRVDSNGEVLLAVDFDTLEELLWDNFDKAVELFGVKKIDAEWYDGLTDMPVELCGTYIIKGIYAPDLSYIPGDYAKREYFFVQEGF